MSYRYIGNKSRLTEVLLQHIKSLVPPGGTIADPMCGTASVSEALRLAGYSVVAADVMTFAVQHAQVRLLLKDHPDFNDLELGSYEAVLGHLNHLQPRDGLFVREYSPVGYPWPEFPRGSISLPTMPLVSTQSDMNSERGKTPDY